MSCKVWEDWLDAYIDNGCTAEETAGIEDHLKTCAGCSTEALARFRLKRDTWSSASERFVPSPEFRARLLHSIENPGKPGIPWLDLSRWKMPKLTKGWKQGLAAGTAALVLILIVWGVVWSRRSTRELALAQLLDLHVATLASSNPVDVVSSDMHTVKPWFGGKLPYSFNLPELNGTSYKLIGGKLIYYKGRPAAQVLFDLRKHVISVFILQEQPGATPKSLGVATARQKGFNEETWGQSGLRYVVMGDTNAADVHALGELERNAARQ